MMMAAMRRWLGTGRGMGGGGGTIRELSSGRKKAVNVRKVNPKVPFPEATSIAHSLYQLLHQRGPLSVSNTWSLAQEANISGLQSKTHMKIMLKWMRGRNMLKLLCNHVGSTKKFLHCTLPEQHQPSTSPQPEQELQTKRRPSSSKRKSNKRKSNASSQPLPSSFIG